MDELFGVVIGIFELAAYFFIDRYQSRGPIEAVGYHSEETYPEEMIRFATGFLGLGVKKVHQREENESTTWLLELTSPKKRRKDVLALVYRIDDGNWSPLAALRPRLPSNLYMRRNSDCTLGQLGLLPRRQRNAFVAPGWKVFAEKNGFPGESFLQHLAYSLQAPDNKELSGIAFTGPYLVVWSDRGKVKNFLRAGNAFGSRLFSPGNDD